jgi:PAS domain S-box-containing protein
MDEPSIMDLAPRLWAALAADDAEQALAEALAILGEAGITAEEPGTSPPWLTLEHRGRRLALHARGELPDAKERALVGGLLRVALARVADREAERRARERMDMLSAASFEGILIHVDGVVIDANQRVAEMLGYEQHELLGPTIQHNCVAPEDLPGVMARLQSRYEGEYVITGVRKDGTRFRAELQTKQGRLGERPVRVVAFRDVTERERTSALLRESETRLRDLAEAAFDVVVLSQEGRIVEMLGAVQKLMGRKPEEMVGRVMLDFVAPEARAQVARMIAEQRTGAYEAAVLRPDGEVAPVEVVGVESTLEGAPVRIAGLRDLREARRLERERRDLEQRVEHGQRLESLGVLAGGIAHDFNNLLVGVLGNADVLVERLREPVERQVALAIRAAGDRAAALTAQMLAYAGQRDLGRREAVDLAELWRELTALLDAALSKKAQLEVSMQPGSVVQGDRATLTQVLMNLLTNASDSLENRTGSIHLSTRRISEPDPRFQRALGVRVVPGDWVLTEVRDTGVGMNAETMGRVFEPFFSTKQKGHGLGLAACLGIISAHGGAILVESEPGCGSCFSVLLPAAEPARAAAAKAPGGERRLPCRVLVVDDEEAVRMFLHRALEQRGYAVAEAGDGRSALTALAGDGADVVVLDMTMPDLDGAEVVRRVREAGSRVPIVLSSGYVDAAQERALDRASFQGFLSKPYRIADVVEAIERARAYP